MSLQAVAQHQETGKDEMRNQSNRQGMKIKISKKEKVGGIKDTVEQTCVMRLQMSNKQPLANPSEERHKREQGKNGHRYNRSNYGDTEGWSRGCHKTTHPCVNVNRCWM
jgi:hypothetical protein